MNNIEKVCLETTSGKYASAYKQIEFAIASASVRGVEILKFSCENSLCKSFRSNMKRAIRHFKKAGKLQCFVFGENFEGDNDVTRYLLQKSEYLKNDDDFEKGNEDIALVYVNSKS